MVSKVLASAVVRTTTKPKMSLMERWENQSPSSLRKRSLESMNWFKGKARNLKSRQEPLQRDIGQFVGGNPISLRRGKMYMFFYDAKTKKKLPYWDRFPCMIPLDHREGQILGVNLHYIAPRHRILLLDELFRRTNNEDFDDTTHFRIFYDMIKAVSRLKYAKPCLKWYIAGRIQSRVTEVPTNYWEIVALMPAALWEGAHANHVYAKSRRKF